MVGAFAIAASWQSYQYALISTLRVKSPELALSISPSDSGALARVVTHKIKADGRYQGSSEDVRAAIASLKSTPLSRSSLRIIGANAEIEGHEERAMHAMKLSHSVSRRDTLAQVWLLEKAAQRQDFKTFLTHYHAALSVEPEFGNSLNPVFATAVEYPELHQVIRQYLRSNANWTAAFLSVASEKANPKDLFEMVLPVTRWLSNEKYEYAISRTANRLAADGDWEDAMVLAESTWSDFDAQDFSKHAPSRASVDQRLGRLAWTFVSDNGIRARLSQDGLIEVSINPLSRGVVLFRDLPINASGEYTFSYRVKYLGGGEKARISWSAHCVNSAEDPRKQIWDQAIPTRAEPTIFRSTIDVPSNCKLLTLTLFGTGPESHPPSNLSMNQIEFRRSRQ